MSLHRRYAKFECFSKISKCKVPRAPRTLLRSPSPPSLAAIWALFLPLNFPTAFSPQKYPQSLQSPGVTVCCLLTSLKYNMPSFLFNYNSSVPVHPMKILRSSKPNYISIQFKLTSGVTGVLGYSPAGLMGRTVLTLATAGGVTYLHQMF